MNHPNFGKITPQPIIGRSATAIQLQKLAFTPGSEVWIKVNNNQPYQAIITPDWGLEATRAINPKNPDGTPKLHADKNKVWEVKGSRYPDGVAHFQKLAKQGKQIYVIPNKAQTGIRAVDVTRLTHFFIEIDDRPIPEQWAKVQEFADATGLIPCLIIFSGGKSLHIYFALNQAIASATGVDVWQRIQRKLILIFRSDPQIQNLNREMRLAGVSRKDKEVSVDFHSDQKYSLEEFEQRIDSLGYFPHGLSTERWSKAQKLLRSKVSDEQLRELLAASDEILFPQPLPRAAKVNPPKNQKQNSVKVSLAPGEVFPLKLALTRDDQDLIASGISAGGAGRNPTGYKIAANAIATAAALDNLGIQHTNNGYELLEQFCQRCNPPLPPEEIERIWSQAEKFAVASSLSVEQIQSRVRLWKWDREYEEYIERERENARVEESIEQVGLPDFLRGLTNKVVKSFKGFGKSKDNSTTSASHSNKKQWNNHKLITRADIQPPEVYRNEGSPLLMYRPGDMPYIWQQARIKGYKAALDGSLTGVGKSETVGRQKVDSWFEQIEKEDENGNTKQKLFYASESGANTTAPSLEIWTPLARRHDGLIERFDKLTGGGKPFIERPKPGEVATIRGNCSLTKLHHLLGSKNIGVAGSKSNETKDGVSDSHPICNICSNLANCKDGGFKQERRESLKESRIKGTISAFPSDGDFQVVGFVDEASSTIQATKEISAKLVDVEKAFFSLYQCDKDLHDKLEFIYGVLGTYLCEQNPPKYGYDLATIKSWFENRFDSQDFSTAVYHLELLTQNVITKELGKITNERQSLEEINELVTLNWLLPFCKIMGGFLKGSVRITNKEIIVTIPNDQELGTIRSWDFTVLLDATGDRDELARILGYEPHEVLWVMQIPQKKVFSNMPIIQVTGLGKCGKNRRELAKRRIDATTQGIKDWASGKVPNQKLNNLLGEPEDIFPEGFEEDRLACIRHLKYKQSGDLHFFGGANGHRGSNAAQNCQILIQEGLANENLGAALAKYHTIYGGHCTLDDPDFLEWYNRRVLAETVQGCGRTRATRRPEEVIPVFILNDADLSGLTSQYGMSVQQVDAFEISLEAGNQNQTTALKIMRAVESLREQKQKIVQKAVAEVAGISQPLVSKLASKLGGWRRLKKLLLVLLNGPTSKSNIFEQMEDLTDLERDMVNGFFIPVLEAELGLIEEAESPEAVAEAVAEAYRVIPQAVEGVIREVGFKGLAKALLLRVVPVEVQARLLGLILGEIDYVMDF